MPLALDERSLFRYVGGLLAYDCFVLDEDTRPHLWIMDRTIADRDPLVADRFIQRVGPNLRQCALSKRLASRLSDRRDCAGRANGLLRGGEHKVRDSAAWVLDWVYANVHRTPGAQAVRACADDVPTRSP